jgi:hypothetical protein
MDLNGNGKIDVGEQLLANVRVVTGGGRDTLTDAQGQFILGDLPPGEHLILIDEKALPKNTISVAGSLRVNIEAGGNLQFGRKFEELSLVPFLLLTDTYMCYWICPHQTGQIPCQWR